MQKCELILIALRCWGIVVSVIYAASGEELLELSCVNTVHCQQFHHSDIVADCVNNRCECRTEDGIGVECLPQNAKKNNIIGGMCPCLQPHAECHAQQNVCYCERDYMASADLRRCLKRTVALGGPCEMHEQCEDGNVFAHCEEKERRCQCRYGYMQLADNCLASLGRHIVRLNCSNHIDCQAEFGTLSVCEGGESPTAPGHCVCPRGYVSASDGRSCLPPVAYKDNCLVHAQCESTLGAGARCTADICRCNTAQYEERAMLAEGNTTRIMCFARPLLATYCLSDEDCHEAAVVPDTHIDQGMFCQYGQCNCREGYVATKDRYCVSDAAVPLHAACPLGWLFLVLIGLLRITDL